MLVVFVSLMILKRTSYKFRPVVSNQCSEISLVWCTQWDTGVTTHFEKSRTLKFFFQSTLNLGPSQRTLEKKWGILTHIEKEIRKSYCAWLALFFLFKNFKNIYLFRKCIDLYKPVIDNSINCSFICHWFEEVLLG